MKIEFVGAAHTVTGSSYIIKNDDFTIMVDCGMFQGTRELRERNHLKMIYAPEKIDALLVTHAHIDHSGLIPKLVKDGFKGPIFATTATTDLLKIMLPDSAHIQEMDAEYSSRKSKKAGREAVAALYTIEDATASLTHLKPIDYDNTFEVVPGVKARFKDAGHILGSSFIEMWITEKGETKKIVFSGDLGPKDQAIIRDAEPFEDADYLLIESTYGDRLHKSKTDTYKEFRDIINSTFNSKGNIVIPSFAVERTQEIIFILGQLFKAGEIPKIPVYIDSPLAVNSTEIFAHHPECYNEAMKKIIQSGGTPLDFPNLHYVKTTEESKSLNDKAKGSIIISASGMCTAGRIKYHLQNNLYKKDSSIIFVGFQAGGTLGRMLVDGAKEVRIFGDSVIVKAKIHTLGGFSGHADRDRLLEWLGTNRNPKIQVFVVHGETSAAESFGETIRQKFGYKVAVPNWGEVIDLETMKSEMMSYGEFSEDLNVHVQDEMDELKSLMRDIEERYAALKDDKSIKGYRFSRFRDELEDLKRTMKIIKEKI
jgi:metallo-beta-lactamase family protein